MKRTIIIFAVIAMMTISAYPASLSFVVGSVKVKSAAKWIDAGPGMTIKRGDTVKTMPKSLALIDLGTGSVVKIYPDSVFTLKGDLASKEGALLDLSAGTVFTKIAKGSGPKNLSIKHGTIVASVRGTLFYFALHKKLVAANDLWICVKEGSVEVKDAGTNAAVTVKEGEGILVKGGKQITPPKVYQWTTKLNWNMDPSKGSLVDKSILQGEDFPPVY